LSAAGILVRLPGGAGPLFIGTIVAGLGIAVGNVLVPALIKRDFPDRLGAMTGAYVMALGLGGALAAGLTVPIENALNTDWRPALAVWALPPLLAAMAWAPRAARGARLAWSSTSPLSPSRALWGDPLAWQVTGFMGLNSLSFYAVLSWLPEIFGDEGVNRAAAGGLLSVLMVASIPTCLVVPALAARMRDQRAAVVATIGVLAFGLLGLLLAPNDAPAVWVTAIGAAQGALLALAFLFFALRTPDAVRAGQLAAMAQTIGYLLAAAGPLVVGLLHDITGDWSGSLAFLLAMLLPLLACGWAAGRDRVVRR
jgi:MFS transporter, CP family, cyanate transporter